MTKKQLNIKPLNIGLIVPHIFMQKKILKDVIFSPGFLALDLAEGLAKLGHKVTLFTPGIVDTKVKNITVDLKNFETELKSREISYLDLLRSKALVFVTLARQVQAELLAKAFIMANKGQFDILHVYINEEELGLVFAGLCNKPIVFTHHEPFNFLLRYRSIMPKYKDLNWIAISNAQKKSMPKDTNFIKTVYHGLPRNQFKFNKNPKGDYFAYFGRIIEPKGVHLAIQACKKAKVKLKIAGKHYTGHSKDAYWTKVILPEIDGKNIEYVGFINDAKKKQEFLGNALGLIVPSTWEEPFGMVTIEALACGTPVIGSSKGATPEIITYGRTGFIIDFDNRNKISNLVKAIKDIKNIDRADCRKDFETRFVSEIMVKNYSDAYLELVTKAAKR